MATYGPPADSQLPSFDEVISYSFASDLEMVGRWRSRAGAEQLRAIGEGDEVFATLIRIPQGLWLGGRSISNLGIAGVGTAPARRGEGHAHALMQALLREAREDGFAISTLYPATVALYQRSGYELAGGNYCWKGPLDRAQRRRSAASIRPATDEDLPAIRALYTSVAKHRDGNLDRGPYVWARIFDPRFERADRFIVEEHGAITGYTAFIKRIVSFPFHALDCTDLLAASPAALDRLLDFFATHASMVHEVTWTSGPLCPFASHWPEARASVSMESPFMVRICHVNAALEERGYGAHVKQKIALEVTDELLPENNGRFTLCVEGGIGSVKPGGSGGLALSIRGLAALFSGYQSARTLRSMGWISGDDAAIEASEHIFCAQSPWMDHLF